MPTRGEARGRATARLQAARIATPALDADVLLAHVLGVGKTELVAHPEIALGAAEWERFEALIERRAAGEPIAYLRGFKEFYGLRFAVDRRVLIPRPESEVLVDAALECAGDRPLVAVDVGTGCGAIAVALVVHAPRLRVIATDVSADALAVARANAAAHRISVEFRDGDLFVPLREQADLITANLPYLREDALAELGGERTSLAFEPRVATVAGPDGLAVIRRAIAALPAALASDGAAFFECDPPQVGEVSRLLAPLGTVDVRRDLSGAERVVGVRPAR